MTEPVIAKKASYIVHLEAGKSYWWCACGLSKDQPWCDGSHQGTGIDPVEFSVEEGGRNYLCGCKHAKQPVFCDGTHNEL